MLAAALFDIDGTLVDTTAAIREALTEVLRQEGVAPTWEEIKRGWTLPAADRMQLWVPDRERAEVLATRYVERYLALQDSLSKPYPGMAATLDGLAARGTPLGVVTSKRRATAIRTLAVFGLERFFHVIVCEEDAPLPKPDPAPLLLAAARLQVSPAATVMIGDGDVDVRAGRAAGMLTAGALWGTVDREALRRAEPTWLLRAPADVLVLFQSRFPD